MALIYWEWMILDSKMTFEKHLRSVSRVASQRLGILRSPGEYSMIDRFLGGAFGVLSSKFWSTVLQCGARLQIHTFNYWTVWSEVPVFNMRECLSVTWQIVALSSIINVVYAIRCKPITLIMVRYLSRMCQCGLHTVIWSHIGILMGLLVFRTSQYHMTFVLLRVSL